MASVIDSLRGGFTEPRRDALWGHIYLTPELEAVSESEPFMKLHRIMQLGPAYLCYPGATHTRAAHSFGVYHLTRRILLHLAKEGADAVLHREGVMSMLCAALLHDAGHYPYAHSLKELPLAAHEALSARLIQTEPLASLIGKTGADPAFTAAIIDQTIDGAGSELALYRTVLSGSLDPDKLDYLNRDARCCGVPYGAQDVDFVISKLHYGRDGLQIDAQGVPSVESVLFSKYLMYRSVYWHRRVRCATSMVKKAVYLGLRDGIVQKEDFYEIDDAELFALLPAERHPAFALAQKVRRGQLFTLVRESRYNEAEHSGILPLENRLAEEERIAAELSREDKAHGKALKPEQVVIDIPEEIVFETGMRLGGGVFDNGIVDSFSSALRMVRVYAEI
ncbi:MAG: HD domain-containing protein [Spirochaetaceae bacterium]|nr:HD domain-containing protein [Spirochaetaceae bacterium]